MENKNVFWGKDWLKLDNAAKVFPGQVTKTWANIIRYSINLTVEIDPELLKQALTDILPRFPSMCVKIKRGFFWYYFEYNDKIVLLVCVNYGTSTANVGFECFCFGLDFYNEDPDAAAEFLCDDPGFQGTQTNPANSINFMHHLNQC